MAPLPTKADAFFTNTNSGDKPFVSTGDRWLKIRLTLETAGNVFYGTQSDIVPPATKGCVLTPHVEKTIVLGPGTDLYIRSDGVNRVSIVQEPVPEAVFGQQIVDLLQKVTNPAAPGIRPVSAGVGRY